MKHRDFDTGPTEPMLFSLEPSAAPRVNPPENADGCPEWDEGLEKLRGIMMPSNEFLAHHAGCGRCQAATGHHVAEPLPPPPEAPKRPEPPPPALGWSSGQMAALIVVAILASLLGLAFVIG